MNRCHKAILLVGTSLALATLPVIQYYRVTCSLSVPAGWVELEASGILPAYYENGEMFLSKMPPIKIKEHIEEAGYDLQLSSIGMLHTKTLYAFPFEGQFTTHVYPNVNSSGMVIITTENIKATWR